MFNPTLRTLAVAFALAAAAAAPPVSAQADYPNKPIRMVVPFPSGGTIDLVARLAADRMRADFGQPVIVDNRAGANGNIGADAVAKAAPDGYTLMMGTNAIYSINPVLYANLPFNPAKDFVPIARLAIAPNVMVVHPSVPARDLKEFIALAKAKPGSINYASGGSGSTGHLATEMLKTAAGIDIAHIPYRGGPAAITDTLSGQTSLVLFPPPALMGHIKSGGLKPIVVTGATRSPLLPDVPTVAESGYPGFEAVAWFGLFAPAGTPASVQAKLASALAKIVAQPDFAEKLGQQGAELAYLDAAAFAAFLKADAVKWAKVAKDSGAKVD